MDKKLKTINRIEPFAGYSNMMDLINAQQQAIDGYADDPETIDFELISTSVASVFSERSGQIWYGTITYRFKKYVRA